VGKYEKMAAEILRIIPPQQIVSVENCMTRLRLVLRDSAAVDREAVKKIAGVLGINEASGQFQIVVGPGAAAQLKKAFDALYETEVSQKAMLQRHAVGDGRALHEKIRRKNATPLKLALKKISGIFLPLIPAFIACGLIAGLSNVLLKIAPALEGGAWLKLFEIAGSAVFFALPILVGVNAAKEFGATPMLGGTLAAVISHPALAQVELFGAPLQPGRGGVIAVVLVAAFAACLEKRLHRIVPEMFDLFLTPLCTLLIAAFAAVFALQPLGGLISESIGAATAVSMERGGAVTGFLLGGSFLPLVMTGLHQGLTPIHADLLATTGVTVLLPVLAMAGAGQVGASLAVYCKTKNAFLRRTIASALPVGLMGVGEPLIYGVTLPLGRPFIAACIGGACGGAVQAYFSIGATSIGISGLPLAACTDHALLYLAGLLTAYTGGFIATCLIGFDDPAEVTEGQA